MGSPIVADLLPGPEKIERRFEALRLHAPEGWFAVLLPLLPLPLPQEQRERYAIALAKLVDALRGSGERSVFLEIEELHRNNAVREISRNGARWVPEMGMGIEPDMAPPRLWSFAELSERSVSEPLPPLIRNVCHLEGEEPARVHAARTMCGTGALLQITHRIAADRLMRGWTGQALQRIEEEALRAYPFYLPLLSAQAVQNASTQQLEQWLGPVDAYLRESMADRGLLVLARKAPELFLEGTDIFLPETIAGE